MRTRYDISRRQILGIAAGTFTLSLAGCVGDDDNANDVDNLVMAGTDDEPFQFVPDTIDISVGETVTWRWGTDTHNIAVESQPDDADWPGHPEIEDTNYEYSYTFEVPGTYHYICEPHVKADMVGTVIVTE